MKETLYDKIWNDHLVHEQPDGTCLLYIDRPLVHDRQRRAFAVVYYTRSATRDEQAYQAYQQRLEKQHLAMGLKEVDA